MNYILIEDLTKTYGIKSLFEHITFGIQKGQKVALVARNGSGKTTLLNIMSGKEKPDSGKVVFRNGLTIGFLEQEPLFDPQKNILESVFTPDNPVSAATSHYEALLLRVTEGETGLDDALSEAIAEMDRLQAWDFEARAKTVLSKLKLDHYTQVTGELSGGQKKRLALAAVLLREPDILILDEPTNHLDIDMIEWLEDFLSAPNFTILMVTHDRYFLDAICTDVYEMDKGGIHQYHGDYAYFLEKKAEREQNLMAETDKAKNLYYRELEWVRRMPKARGTKAKSRLDAFDEVKEKAFALRKHKEMEIQFRMKRMGSKILELIKVSKAYDTKTLLDKFTYSFRKGERIGIVGANGTGKSTLLKMILEQEMPDSGKIVTGDTIEFGYYSQDGITVAEDKRVIEVIREIADVIDTDKSGSITASQMLLKFDFPPEMQYNYVNRLSGGEKRRLYLLTVLLRNPNFLILDEPTNDLDILTLQKLEVFLEDFEGCILMVSHDRQFMDRLADQIFVFEGDGKVTIYPGTYSEYKIKRAEEEALKKQPAIKPAISETEPGKPKEKKKLSYKEKLEYEELETSIPVLEEKRKIMETQLAEGTVPHDKLLEFTDELGKLISDLDRKSDRWLELGEWIN